MKVSKRGLIRETSRKKSNKELRKLATYYPGSLSTTYPVRDDEDEFLRRNIRL